MKRRRNRIVLIIGCILLILDIVMLVKMEDMKKQLDDLTIYEQELLTEIESLENK